MPQIKISALKGLVQEKSTVSGGNLISQEDVTVITTSPGQPSDHFWKYLMMNGQLGSRGDACEVGTRGFTALGKKGLEYFDATRPPGAAAA